MNCATAVPEAAPSCSPPSASKRQGRVPVRRQRRGKLFILIADDHDDARYMYEGYLRSLGHEVVTASSGREAFVRAQALLPDVVVMDIEMPVLTGDAATRLLKNDPYTRHIPVIALTAFGSEAVRKAELAGCDLVREKPLLPIDLFEVIQGVLQHRPRAPRRPASRPRKRN